MEEQDRQPKLRVAFLCHGYLELDSQFINSYGGVAPQVVH
jgi:hypothetical protein